MIDRSKSVYVGNLGPIPLFLHWSFFILLYLAWPGGGWTDISFSLTFVIILLSAILLHEMGHALAAKTQGAIGVTITLWALGGLCSSRRDSLPRRELIILIAGPAVSFALAWGCHLAISYLGARNPALLVQSDGSPTMAGTALLLGYFVNLRLGIFNILPIFPLDGGQITFQAARLFVGDRKAAVFSLVLAVVGAIAYVGWDAYQRGGQISLGLAAMMLFLLYNAFVYLR